MTASAPANAASIPDLRQSRALMPLGSGRGWPGQGRCDPTLQAQVSGGSLENHLEGSRPKHRYRYRLTLGVAPLQGVWGQLAKVILQQQLIAGDALHRLQHVVLQSQVTAHLLALEQERSKLETLAHSRHCLPWLPAAEE